jgi:hypothetical protein
MELRKRIKLLEAQKEAYQKDLEALLSGGIDDVAPDEISFTVEEINRIEKELASIRDVYRHE